MVSAAVVSSLRANNRNLLFDVSNSTVLNNVLIAKMSMCETSIPQIQNLIDTTTKGITAGAVALCLSAGMTMMTHPTFAKIGLVAAMILFGVFLMHRNTLQNLVPLYQRQLSTLRNMQTQLADASQYSRFQVYVQQTHQITRINYDKLYACMEDFLKQNR
jgi:hypothetical protein